MTKTKKLTLPWHLLALDFVGATLAAWGIYLYVSEERGLLYVAAGLLLMAPLVVHIINWMPKNNSSKKESP